MQHSMQSLEGKTAFITGGASGIGLGIAKAAHKEGMNIVIADLRQTAIDEALGCFSDRAMGIKLDVSDRGAYRAAADEAAAKFGNIHLLVNNAGIGGAHAPLWEVSTKDTDFALRVNILGVLNGIQEIVPRMLAHGEGGFVVSTASKAALIPVPNCGLYNLTKQAVIGIMETLRCDLPEGYSAAVLCPGPFKSSLGTSGREVQEELLGEKLPPMAPPVQKDGGDAPPPFAFPADIDFSRIERTIEEAGERVIRGIKNNDMYILTHSEFKAGYKERTEAILRAFPDEEPYDGFAKVFGFLARNPVFGQQKQVPAFPGHGK
ncbi:MAG: SDR family NAD(P)-dependent oxidoreductase [Oscillospiraceae bacterium]|nr:SDR family NAD(P)-dependent oxidoreductase [Oscillospiraceae bacterium]